MIEITNITRGPVQVMVRSGSAPRSFTTLIIPGIGAGNNVRIIDDEMVTPEMKRVEKEFKLISTKYIPNSTRGE